MAEIKELDLCKSIAKKKPFIFITIAAGVLFLSTTLSPETAKSISREDGLVENLTTFILLATTALGLFSALRQNQRKRTVAIISAISFLAFLSELSFGERIFNLDMPHAGGKQLDGVHDLLHMIQKIFIANYNYHQAGTTAVTAALIGLAMLATYAIRKTIYRININLKELRIRYMIILSIVFAAIAQGFDLNIFPYKNYRILEETLELLSALCLFSAVFKIKLHAHLNTNQ
tara:strand:+ start:785 stop:1480 length:696 start_codon:yes stop_codon:yes gene_type:complete